MSRFPNEILLVASINQLDADAVVRRWLNKDRLVQTRTGDAKVSNRVTKGTGILLSISLYRSHFTPRSSLPNIYHRHCKISKSSSCYHTFPLSHSILAKKEIGISRSSNSVKSLEKTCNRPQRQGSNFPLSIFSSSSPLDSPCSHVGVLALLLRSLRLAQLSEKVPRSTNVFQRHMWECSTRTRSRKQQLSVHSRPVGLAFSLWSIIRASLTDYAGRWYRHPVTTTSRMTSSAVCHQIILLVNGADGSNLLLAAHSQAPRSLLSVLGFR